jgi:enoyl-CoA hydratase
MQVGQVHTEHIEITPKLVQDFANLSGDFNPIHLDVEYARTTPFQRPIAHGMLTAALLSGIIGTRFPGRGTILLESELKFSKPVFVGDTVLFRLSVEHVRPDKPIVTLKCEILNSAGEITSAGNTVIKTPL